MGKSAQTKITVKATIGRAKFHLNRTYHWIRRLGPKAKYPDNISVGQSIKRV
jgi:hypothetical protein